VCVVASHAAISFATGGHSLAWQQADGETQMLAVWHSLFAPHEGVHAPAEQEAVPPVGAEHERVPCGAPVGTGEHVPRRPARLHAMQLAVQTWLQQ
jgi:hypothetical protein